MKDTDLVGLNHGAPSAIQLGVVVGADEARVVLGVLVAVVLPDVDDTMVVAPTVFESVIQ